MNNISELAGVMQSLNPQYILAIFSFFLKALHRTNIQAKLNVLSIVTIYLGEHLYGMSLIVSFVQFC